MATAISMELERIIKNKSGRPSHKVSLYDTNFAWNSKGLMATWCKVWSTGVYDWAREKSPDSPGQEDFLIYGDSVETVMGRPLRTDYVSQLRYWWGAGLPLGLEGHFSYEKTEDGRYNYDGGWGVIFHGYFLVPQSGRFRLRIFSRLYVRVLSNDEELLFSDCSTGEETDIFTADEGYAIPITIIATQIHNPEDNLSPTEMNDTYFLAEWRQSRSKGTTYEDWRMVDAGFFTPGATVVNVAGNAVRTLSDRYSNTKGQFSDFVPSVKVDQSQLMGEPSSTVTYTEGVWLQDDEYTLTFTHYGQGRYVYYVDGVEQGVADSFTSSFVDLGEGKGVSIDWGLIEPNSKVRVEAPSYLNPLVSNDGLPHISEIREERTEGQATMFTFTVPMTKGKWNPRYVTPDNCYSHDSSAKSMGILRKGRFLEIEQGYSGQRVTRFKGFISDIETHRSGDSTMITVQCIDLSHLLITRQSVESPDFLSWIRYGNNVKFNEFGGTISRSQIDSQYKPSCYDSWLLSDVVTDICYKAGLTSQSVVAVDANELRYIVDNDTRIPRSINYPFKTVIGVHGDEISADYLWQIEFGTYYWDIIKRIHTEFGRPFRILPDGIVDFRLPNNSNLIKWYYDPESSANSEFKAIHGLDTITPKVTPTMDIRGIRGFYYRQTGEEEDAWIIEFWGHGLSIIMNRGGYQPRFIQVEVDDVLIDGTTNLDEDTEDTGDVEYTSQLDEYHRYPLRLQDADGNPIFDEHLKDGFWAYKNGVFPPLGYNPCVIPLCRNLTWGKHIVKIHTQGDGYFFLDGAFIFKDDLNTTAHIFSESAELKDIHMVESDEDVRNQVVVSGTIRGPSGNIIVSKATHVDSIRNPEDPIYVGYEKPLTLISKSVHTQSKADFIAQNLLSRYARAIRRLSVTSIGMPKLVESDAIAITSKKLGLWRPLVLQTGGNINVIDLDRNSRYWITSLSSTMTENDWSMNYELVPFEPVPAFQPIQDPPDIWGEHLIQNVKVTLHNPPGQVATYDGQSYQGKWLPVFNCYREDSAGTRVKVEFDLAWNVKYLQVSVHNRREYRYKKYANLAWDTGNAETMPANEPLHMLFWHEDYLEAGHYEMYWDGWWAPQESKKEGGESRGARYMPSRYVSTREQERIDAGLSQSNLAEFYFRIHAQRESDGRTMVYRTDDDIHIDSSDIGPRYILNDPYPAYATETSHGVFTVNQHTPTYTYPSAQEYSGKTYIDYTIYDDNTNQSKDPGTFKVDIQTYAPMWFETKVFVWLLQAPKLNGSLDIPQWIIDGHVVPIFASPEIFPDGTYSFAFSPSVHLRNVYSSDSPYISQLFTSESVYMDDLKQKAYDLLPGLAEDTAIPFNYVHPDLMNTGYPVYSAWLFYFPSNIPAFGQIGGGMGEAGFMCYDKDRRMFSNSAGRVQGTSDQSKGILVQWFGDSTLYSTTQTRQVQRKFYTDRLLLPRGKTDTTDKDLKVYPFYIPIDNPITFVKVYDPI